MSRQLFVSSSLTTPKTIDRQYRSQYIANMLLIYRQYVGAAEITGISVSTDIYRQYISLGYIGSKDIFENVSISIAQAILKHQIWIFLVTPIYRSL